MSTAWAESAGSEPYLNDAVSAVRSIELAARVLRAVAMTAAAVWLLGTIATALFIWDQTEQLSSSGAFGASLELGDDAGQRVVQTISSTVSATWGYALVTVVALFGWLFAESRRAAVFLDAMDEVEEMRGPDIRLPPEPFPPDAAQPT